MAQSIITQVSREGDTYTPCHPSDRASVNGTPRSMAAAASSRAAKPQKFRTAWCFCNWVLACFKKEEPAVAAATFEGECPPTPEPQPNKYLLPSKGPGEDKRKCVIIDLDETLVHSSFKPVSTADFIVPVEIDGVIHQVYVTKRPHCDEFLKRMGEMFECILFTASLAKYADPVADLLDCHKTFESRLFRESCVFHRGNYVKDLSRLGRDLRQVVIVDNSPQSYIFHPDNAVPVTSWFDDPNDTELLDLIPFFEALNKVDNVLTVLGQSHHFQNPTASEESESQELQQPS